MVRSHEKQFCNICNYSFWGSDPVPLKSTVVSFQTFMGAEYCSSDFSTCRAYWWLYLLIHPQNCWHMQFLPFLLVRSSCLRDLWNIAAHFLTTTQRCEGSANPPALGQSPDKEHCDQPWSSASQTHLGMGVLVPQLISWLMSVMAEGQEAGEREMFKEGDCWDSGIL